MAAGLLVLCYSLGPPRDAHGDRGSSAALNPSRTLNEAWFAWRVRADTELALTKLQELADDERAGNGWRARAREMLRACRVQIGDQTANPEVTQKAAPLLPVPNTKAEDESRVFAGKQVPDQQKDQGIPSESWIPGSGILLDRPQDLPPMPRGEDSLERQVECLDARARAWRNALSSFANPVDAAGSPREVKSQKKGGVIVLISRWYAGGLGASPETAYELSTMSFEHSVRDDPDRKITHNDWDLSFGNGLDKLDVRMTGGDHSTIQLLSTLGAGPKQSECRAIYGRAYRVHSLDRNTDRTYVFQILEHVAGKWILIVWEEI